MKNYGNCVIKVGENHYYGRYLKFLAEMLEEEELIDDRMTVKELVETLRQRKI